ncbi:PIG-X [Dipodascopsis tothii]|uniref:PIG-X n=1 Tax=Dipodascopsis tothii TaxID=44089 RepID=UPI0034CE7723
MATLAEPRTRERHTFIVASNFRHVPETLALQKDSLDLVDVPGARHSRAILPADALATEDSLAGLKNVKIELSRSENFARAAPFERLAPRGTHVWLETTGEADWARICAWIKQNVQPSAACVGEASFIRLPFGHYLQTANTDGSVFAAHVAGTYCADEACRTAAAGLASADSWTVSVDRQTTDARFRDKIVVEAYWAHGNWSEKIVPAAGSRVEVGVLGRLADSDDTDVTLGGILAVVGETEQFTPTMIDFTPRHRAAARQTVYRADFRKPYGLHPKHVTKIAGDFAPPDVAYADVDLEDALEFTEDGDVVPAASTKAACKLHAYYTLPNFLFVDKYQLSDLADAKAGGVQRVVGIWGETDLEVPVWMVDGWGSSVLLEVLPSPRPPPIPLRPGLEYMELEIPMHSRYEVPDWNTSVVTHEVPWPVLFWACPAAVSEDRLRKNPFESSPLGVERFFDAGTTFHYLTPNLNASTAAEPTHLTSELRIPVVPLETYRWVQPVTVVVIVFGCFWIFYKTACGWRRDGGITKPAPKKAKGRKDAKPEPATPRRRAASPKHTGASVAASGMELRSRALPAAE